MFLDARNHPLHDMPPATAGGRCYVVASTPRTGSTMLCRALWSTGHLGAPKEYLNPTQIRDWQLRRGHQLHRFIRGSGRVALGWMPWSDADLAEYLDYIKQRRSGAGWFGLKIHHHHHRRIFGHRRVQDVLGTVEWIFLVREDRLGQAISWARALQTDRWIFAETEKRAPRYSRALIEHCLRRVEEGEAYWRDFFHREGVHPLCITYEDLIAEPEAHIRAVFAHLGVQPPHAWNLELGRAQRDACSQAWRQRFEREVCLTRAPEHNRQRLPWFRGGQSR